MTALVGVWGTLIGLLFRVGWLAGFEISADLFMPASASEITYFAYLAMLHAWNSLEVSITESLIKLLGFAVGVALLARVVLFLFARFETGAKGMLRKNRAVRESAAIAFVSGSIFFGPLLVLSAVALLLVPPLPAYFSGKKAAGKEIALYQASRRDGNTSGCHTLATATGKIGACPLVVAQTKEHIAYMDGSAVHVISSDGVQVSWAMSIEQPKLVSKP
jgi:hypothetical protein